MTSIKSKNDFIILSILGSGAFGTCYAIQERTTGRQCVLKLVKCDNKSQLIDSLAESIVMRICDSPYLVRFLSSFQTINDELHQYELGLVMEYCDGGDLLGILKNFARSNCLLPISLIERFLAQISIGIQSVHSKQLLHRDIKPCNIFIKSNVTACLGDFGLACLGGRRKILNHNNTRDTENNKNNSSNKKNKSSIAEEEEESKVVGSISGTPGFIAPEVWLGLPFDSRSDIYSIGATLYELMTLRSAYNDIHIFVQERPDENPESNLSSASYSLRLELLLKKHIHSNYSTDWLQLLYRLLAFNPRDRPDSNELLRDRIIMNSVKLINEERPTIDRINGLYEILRCNQNKANNNIKENQNNNNNNKPIELNNKNNKKIANSGDEGGKGQAANNNNNNNIEGEFEFIASDNNLPGSILHTGGMNNNNLSVQIPQSSAASIHLFDIFSLFSFPGPAIIDSLQFIRWNYFPFINFDSFIQQFSMISSSTTVVDNINNNNNNNNINNMNSPIHFQSPILLRELQLNYLYNQPKKFYSLISFIGLFPLLLLLLGFFIGLSLSYIIMAFILIFTSSLASYIHYTNNNNNNSTIMKFGPIPIEEFTSLLSISSIFIISLRLFHSILNSHSFSSLLYISSHSLLLILLLSLLIIFCCLFSSLDSYSLALQLSTTPSNSIERSHIHYSQLSYIRSYITLAMAIPHSSNSSSLFTIQFIFSRLLLIIFSYTISRLSPIRSLKLLGNGNNNGNNHIELELSSLITYLFLLSLPELRIQLIFIIPVISVGLAILFCINQSRTMSIARLSFAAVQQKNSASSTTTITTASSLISSYTNSSPIGLLFAFAISTVIIISATMALVAA